VCLGLFEAMGTGGRSTVGAGRRSTVGAGRRGAMGAGNVGVTAAREAAVGTNGGCAGGASVGRVLASCAGGGGTGGRLVLVAGVTNDIAAILVMPAVISVEALGAALEVIASLAATLKDATLLLELRQADGGEGGGAVVLGRLVVNLVDRDSGVDNLGLDNLLVDNREDLLVDVVVNVLALNSGGAALGGLGLNYVTLVTVLVALSLEHLPGVIILSVVDLALLNAGNAVLMLLREDLLVEDGLDSAVVVVLVDLLLNSSLDLLVTSRLDSLLCDGGANVLMDGGIVTSLGLNIVKNLLCLVHFEGSEGGEMCGGVYCV